MATINFLNTINFNGNETQNQVIHNLAANPSAANSELGQIYFNTASNELRVCTNASTPTWVAVGGYSDADVDAHLNTGTATSGQILSWTGSDYDWIDQNTGDITAVNTATGSGLSGGTTAGAANLQVEVDGTTIEIATNTIQANTAAVTNGGTSLATGDQIYDFVIAQGYGTMSSFDAAGNTGTAQNISNGNTLSILGDATYIDTEASATDTITITHATISQSNTTSTASPGYGASFDVIDTVSRNGAGHVTGVNVKTVTLPAAYSFSAAGDTGTAQPITNGNTLTIAGSTGIDTVAGATDTVQVFLDLAELSTTTTIDPAADFLVGVDGTANEKILYQNVHLNQWGDAEADVDFGGFKLLDVANGTASTDGVNLGQVQSLISGVGLFQGGYNANTGLTTDLGAGNGSLDGASNIALDKGDFFVVTTGGTAFYSETLEVGDMIYANQDIAANSSPAQSVYTVVIQDENIAGSGATDGATQKGVAGFDSANFDVSATGWVQIKAGGVTLGTETTGTYVTSVVENTTDNNRLGIAVITSGAGDAKTETVGLNIIGQTNLTGLAAGDDFLVYDLSSTTNKRVGADVIATYVKGTIEKRDAYLVLNSATSGVSSTNNGTDTISWTLDLSVLDTNGVIDIGTSVNAVKVEVINVADAGFDTGVTLSPSVERAATTGDITIEFVKKTWATAGLPSQGDYAVLLSYVGAY